MVVRIRDEGKDGCVLRLASFAKIQQQPNTFGYERGGWACNDERTLMDGECGERKRETVRRKKVGASVVDARKSDPREANEPRLVCKSWTGVVAEADLPCCAVQYSNSTVQVATVVSLTHTTGGQTELRFRWYCSRRREESRQSSRDKKATRKSRDRQFAQPGKQRL